MSGANPQDAHQPAIVLTYEQVIGRAPTSSELAYAEQQLAAGTHLTTIRAHLATTGYAAAALRQLYENVVDRAITAPELGRDEQAIAGGSSLGAIRGHLSTSDEAVRAITSQFHSALGYDLEDQAPVPPADLASAEGALRGQSLSLAVAQTPSVANFIDDQFRSLLGTAPNAGELQASEHDIAAVLKTIPVADFPSVIDRVTLVTSAAQNSLEVAADITAAFHAAGKVPTAVELAADRSELQGGFTIGAIRSQIAALGHATPLPAPAGSDYIIAPQTIAGSPSFIYGLFDNDALVASTARIGVDAGIIPSEIYSGKTANNTILIGLNSPSSTHFDPATDFFQIAKAQATSFSDLKLTYGTTPSGGIPYTNVSIGSHTLFTVLVPAASLTAANFKFS